MLVVQVIPGGKFMYRVGQNSVDGQANAGVLRFLTIELEVSID
jgi:uncharacterized protein YggU (UPF0235/DUF167 family)